jgi:hypothetical protein
MLDAVLTSARFRSELLLETFRDFVHQQQFFHWQFYRRDPLADAQRAAEEQQQQQGEAGGGAAAPPVPGVR